jgi:hypothetical protein
MKCEAVDCWERLWFESKESEAVDWIMKLWIVEKGFGLIQTKVKLWIEKKYKSWSCGLLRKAERNMNLEAVDWWEALDCITRKWSCWLLRRLWIGSQESEAVDCWEGFGLDYKKVELLIVEKALNWITRKKLWILEKLLIGSQESKSVDF